MKSFVLVGILSAAALLSSGDNAVGQLCSNSPYPALGSGAVGIQTGTPYTPIDLLQIMQCGNVQIPKPALRISLSGGALYSEFGLETNTSTEGLGMSQPGRSEYSILNDVVVRTNWDGPDAASAGNLLISSQSRGKSIAFLTTNPPQLGSGGSGSAAGPSDEIRMLISYKGVGVGWINPLPGQSINQDNAAFQPSDLLHINGNDNATHPTNANVAQSALEYAALRLTDRTPDNVFYAQLGVEPFQTPNPTTPPPLLSSISAANSVVLRAANFQNTQSQVYSNEGTLGDLIISNQRAGSSIHFATTPQDVEYQQDYNVVAAPQRALPDIERMAITSDGTVCIGTKTNKEFLRSMSS